MKSNKENDYQTAVIAGNLIVGSGVKITGVIAVPNQMEIYGQIEGEIGVKTLKVHLGGKIDALINCENAEINGEASGKLICENNLVLKENAKLTGDVSYVNMEMNVGAELNAKIKKMDHD